jgi:hypothetical protein
VRGNEGANKNGKEWSVGGIAVVDGVQGSGPLAHVAEDA